MLFALLVRMHISILFSVGIKKNYGNKYFTFC